MTRRRNNSRGVKVDVSRPLPVLPLPDVVVYPLMVLPLFVKRRMSVQAVSSALDRSCPIYLVAQRDPDMERPAPDDLYAVGSVGMIIRSRALPDGTMKILVQGLAKARALSYDMSDSGGLVTAEVALLDDTSTTPLRTEDEALMRSARENMETLISLGKELSPDILLVLGSVDDPGRLADLLAANLMLSLADAQVVLEELDPVARLGRMNQILTREIEVLRMQAAIQDKARDSISKGQREYFLREQLKQIKAELGDGDAAQDEIERLRLALDQAGLPDEARKEATRELRRLELMGPESAEASVIRTYLQWLIDLPWQVASEDRRDLTEAARVLNQDHEGLAEVKDRILEFLAVRILKPDHHGPILCLVGPPGVGKTSLGRSIAAALGRRFVRASLGGVRDEAEIRGHRRTYVGAMPGRLVQGMRQAGVNNPVFMLDELDKLGADAMRGDPAAALLEALDLEQNSRFEDHYLGIAFDLSCVLFIATANTLDNIPSALRDRLEVIGIPGYTLEEKITIAARHLVPRELRENGLASGDLALSRAGLSLLAQCYTREAGLRNLQRVIAGLCRKQARRKAEGRPVDGRLGPAVLRRLLGPEPYPVSVAPTEVRPGVANGLAWTPTGGEVLTIEAVAVPGSGRVQLTGRLGEVMKESALLAVSHLHSTAEAQGIARECFDGRDLHIHVPEGAVPKDGPSAGLALAAAITSLLRGEALPADVAMTGELTLTGRILAIGGLREKLLAAHRAGLRAVVFPKANEGELERLPHSVRRRLSLIAVDHLDEALTFLLPTSSTAQRSARSP